MKEFDELTRLGRIRRSRKIIEIALNKYDIMVKRMSFLTEDTNIFFKVVDENNEKYAIKIYDELSSNMNDSIVEMYMINMMSEFTDVKVPCVLKNTEGDDITIITSKYADMQKRIVVYNWLEGKDLDEIETPERLENLGSIVAKMHKTSRNIDLPKHLKPKKMDKVLYFAGDDYFYRYEKHKDKVSDKYIELMDYMIPYLDNKLELLYKSEKPFMIHGDLNPYNVKVFKDELRILDFEDAIYATPVHDISIILFYYRDTEHYTKYRDALFKGYEKIIPLNNFSDDIIEMLIIARQVNFLNFILEISDEPMEYIERNLVKLEAYIEKYIPEYKN